MRRWTDEELTLLAAIHKKPRPNAPRLAYADWLEKNGKPEYAEFIQLQCQEPYIGVVYHPPEAPHVSHNSDFPWKTPRRRSGEIGCLSLCRMCHV
jgi:uncharacterized protein (TIGR02996 family)